MKPPIIVTGKRLLDGEETEIEAMIKEKTDLEVKIERPKQMGLASINNIFNALTSFSLKKKRRQPQLSSLFIPFIAF